MSDLNDESKSDKEKEIQENKFPLERDMFKQIASVINKN